MLDENEIIRRCQCGQIRLMDVLIDRYQVPLYTLCRKLTREPGDADDLFQDTWAAALHRIRSFSLGRPFRPWLFAICVNRYRDRYRKQRRWRLRLQAFRSRDEETRATARIPSPQAGPEEQRNRAERHRALREAVLSLDDLHRLPLLLHYDRGLPLDEVGAILGIPEGTVKSRLAQARGHIRAWMETHGHG